jgi:hypothetical protein
MITDPGPENYQRNSDDGVGFRLIYLSAFALQGRGHTRFCFTNWYQQQWYMGLVGCFEGDTAGPKNSRAGFTMGTPK